jgi:hypothetical protein
LTTVQNLGFSLLSELTTREFARLRAFLAEVKEGETRYPGEDRERLLEEIISTSNGLVDDGFWDTELDERYLRAPR